LADRVLSQDEIDSVFKKLRDAGADQEITRAQPYDFRRPDRIAKDQLRGIHALHENFARALASSLSAYLRAYVMVNLVSVEQISFNGEYARRWHVPVIYVTERAVFELHDDGLVMTEIARGVDLERDVLQQMDFRPRIADPLKNMDARLFGGGTMGLELTDRRTTMEPVR